MEKEKNLRQHLLDRRYAFEDALSLLEWTKDERRSLAEGISGICVLINSDRSLLERPDCIDALKRYVAAEIVLESKHKGAPQVTDEEILEQNDDILHCNISNEFDVVTDEEILAQNDEISHCKIFNEFDAVTDDEILAQNEISM